MQERAVHSHDGCARVLFVAANRCHLAAATGLFSVVSLRVFCKWVRILGSRSTHRRVYSTSLFISTPVPAPTYVCLYVRASVCAPPRARNYVPVFVLCRIYPNCNGKVPSLESWDSSRTPLRVKGSASRPVQRQVRANIVSTASANRRHAYPRVRSRSWPMAGRCMGTKVCCCQALQGPIWRATMRAQRRSVTICQWCAPRRSLS